MHTPLSHPLFTSIIASLKIQQIFHSLTRNTIKAFKFRAQAVFSLWEKKQARHGLHNLSSVFFPSLFYIMGTQGIYI
jgi:hypothetical protein